MMQNAIDDDEYVAKLLKQDAKTTAKKYEMVGLDAFVPQRSRNRAPKPNTNFLRHIIKQTDNHNAALLAKEAEDSRIRLRELDRERQREERRNKLAGKEKGRGSRGAGRLSPPEGLYEDRRERKRARVDSSDEEEEGERDSRRRRRQREDQPKYSASRRERERERTREIRKEKRRHDDSEDDAPRRQPRRLKSDHRDEERHRIKSDEDHHTSRRKEESNYKQRRRRSHSRSTSRSRSPASCSQKRHKESSRRHKSLSPVRKSKGTERRRTKTTDGVKHLKRRSPSPDSNSDPLEAIIGPLPPRAQPPIRSRGRGAHKAHNNAMDERFSTTYNPSTDVHINSDIEDDWGDALEALKDRQQYQQQGAERLKAAGFSDEQVKKWEKGDEKGEEDVQWAKRGEGREWDKGKVVDEDGYVDLKAEWGRLS